MEALKKKMIVNHDGFIDVKYFECVGEDGTGYRLKDWTDYEFNRAGMMSAWKDDDTTAGDIFDV